MHKTSFQKTRFMDGTIILLSSGSYCNFLCLLLQPVHVKLVPRILFDLLFELSGIHHLLQGLQGHLQSGEAVCTISCEIAILRKLVDEVEFGIEIRHLRLQRQ